MSEMKAVDMPEAEEIMRRLTEVFDEPHAVERFYPIIARDAGRRLNGYGVVMMFTLATQDYCTGLPPMMGNIVFMMLPKFVEALIDDEVKTTALKLLADAEARMGS